MGSPAGEPIMLFLAQLQKLSGSWLNQNLIVPEVLGDYLCNRTNRMPVILNAVKDLKPFSPLDYNLGRLLIVINVKLWGYLHFCQSAHINQC